MKFLSSPRIPNVASLPVSANTGDFVYYNNTFYGWTGSSWKALNNDATTIADVSGLQAALNTKLDASSLGTSWSPVTATGTGTSQNITIPESGLATKDVLLTIEGLIQGPTEYSISGTTVTVTAPSGSSIVIRKLNASISVLPCGFGAFVGSVGQNGEVVAGYIAPQAFSINATNCSAKATIAAAAITVYTVKADGTAIGTFTFAAAGTTATVNFTTTSVSSGALLTIEGPATADTTLANIAFRVSQ